MLKQESQNTSNIQEQKSINDTTAHSFDDKKEDALNTDQDTQETQNDNSINIQEEMQFNSFHMEHRFHPQPYNLYLTPITEEIDHERTIVGLKEQNHKLTEQLRFLNRKLTEILSKQQKKVQSKQELEQKSRDITIVQKELENAYKKVEYLQKQNKFLNLKLEKLSPTMILQMESQIKEKDLMIQKQQDEIKAYENIKRIMQKNNSAESKQMDAVTKIDEQEKQINNQNHEIKKLKSIIDNQQKQMIKKQEYQVDLEQRYREICEFIGITSNSKSHLKEELSKIHVTKKAENTPLQDITNNIHIQEKLHSVHESPNKRCQTKQSDIQVKELNSVLKLKEREISQLKAQIQELKGIQRTPEPSLIKNKRSNHSFITKSTGQSPQKYTGKVIQDKKIEMLGQMLVQNKSVPKVIIKDYISKQKENEDPNKLKQNSLHQQSNYSQQVLQPLKEEKERIKKEIVGKQHGCSRTISDRVVLKEQLNSKIVKVIVWTNKRTVNGIQFFYKVNESIIEGAKIVVDRNNEYTQSIFDFSTNTNNNNSNLSFDYLKSIECALSSQGYIDKIKFTTAKGYTYEAGAASNQGRYIQKFNIDECEYPVCGFGGLITFVGEKGQEIGGILSFLGFEVMVDQTALKRCSSKYIPKGFSTFFFDKDLIKQHELQVKEQQVDIFDSRNCSQ